MCLEGGTVNDTARFTNSEYLADNAEAIATAAGSLSSGQDAVAIGAAAVATATANGNPSVGHGLLLAESVPSIAIIVWLTLIRLYFILIMMSYSRQVIRNYMGSASSAQTHFHTDGAADDNLVIPFSSNSPQGQGWRGANLAEP